MTLTANGLSRTFGRHVAVAGADISVSTGSITGLVGPNGAGKTTLLLMLAGLLQPDSGTITVDDSDHIWNLAGLAWGMKGVSGGDGVQTTVPIGGSAGGSNLRWDRTRAQALFGALQNDQAPPESSFGP